MGADFSHEKVNYIINLYLQQKQPREKQRIKSNQNLKKLHWNSQTDSHEGELIFVWGQGDEQGHCDSPSQPCFILISINSSLFQTFIYTSESVLGLGVFFL